MFCPVQRSLSYLNIDMNAPNNYVPGRIGPTNPLNTVFLNAASSAQDIAFVFRGDVSASTIDINGVGTFGDGVTVTGDLYDAEDSIRGGIAFLGNATVNGNLSKQPSDNSLDGARLQGTGTVNFNGDLYLDDPYLVFQAPGAVARIADGKVIAHPSGLVDIVNGTTDATSSGTLEFLGGATVGGTIGARLGLTAVNLRGAAGKVVNFQGNILNGTPLIFLNAATANILDGILIQSVDNKTSATTGTLQFQGASTVNGSIGSTKPVSLVTLNAGGGVKEIVFKGTTVNAETVNFVGGGGNATSLTLDAANMVFTGDITTNNNKLDILNINRNTTLTGNIGSSTHLLSDIWNSGNTVVQGDVFANLIHTKGTSQLQVANGSIIQSDITDYGDGLNGSVAFLGNATVNGNFNTLGSGVDGLYLKGTGTIDFNGDIELDDPYLVFQGASTARMGDGFGIYNPINETNAATSSQGILEFVGNGTVSGRIGNARGLAGIRLTGDATKTVNFQGDILNGTPLIFLNTGTANISNGVSLQSVDNQTSATTGTLQLQGASTVNGSIGNTKPVGLISLNTGGGVKTIVFKGTTINVDTVNFVGGGGNATTLTLDAANMVFTGNITTNNNKLDILNILQSTSFTGDVGTAGNRVSMIQLNGGTLYYDGHAFAGQYQSCGTACTLENVGTIDLSGNQVMNAGTVINNGDINVAAGTLGNTVLTQNAGTITGPVTLANVGGTVLEMKGGTIDGTVSAALNVVNILNLRGGVITKTVTLGNQGDTINFFDTQAQILQGGGGNDILNIQTSNGSFTLADGGGGNNILNVNANFIANGNINAFQTINIAPSKVLTANQLITGLDNLLSLGNSAQIVLAQNVTGAGQVKNAGLIQLNANKILNMGEFINDGDIQMSAGASIIGTKLTQNTGTITGNIFLRGAGGDLFTMNGGVVNGDLTAQGPNQNSFNLNAGAFNGTLNLGNSGDTVNLSNVLVQAIQGGTGNDILNINASVSSGVIENIETIQVNNPGTVFTVSQPIQGVNTLLAVSPNTQLQMNATLRGMGDVQNQGTLQVNNNQVLAMSTVTNQGLLTLQKTALIQSDTFTQNGGGTLRYPLI